MTYWLKKLFEKRYTITKAQLNELERKIKEEYIRSYEAEWVGGEPYSFDIHDWANRNLKEK